jgi:hypothetical protein
MIHYSYETIEYISNSFNATLDEELVNKLLEIKKGNKFIRRKSPLRLKYKIHDSVAQHWRKEREEKELLSNEELFNLEFSGFLNKLSIKNYSTLLDKICELYNQQDNKDDINNKIVNMTFEKALLEKTYSNLYAQLLHDLNINNLSEICKSVSSKFYDTSIDNTIKQFNSEMSDEEVRKIFSTKMQFVGGFIFIANLFIFNLITYENVLQFYNGLIQYFELSPIEYCDTYLDTIEQILNTAGYQLERKAVTKEQFYEDFMSVLYKYQNIKADVNPKMSNKNRFKMMDITDLYKRKWNVKDTNEDNQTDFKKNKEKKRR